MGPQIQETLIDNIMGGMEALIGRRGHYGATQFFNQIDNKYIRHYLICKEKKENLERAFDKVVLQEHYTNLYGPRILVDTTATTTTPTGSLKYTESTNLRTWNKAVASTSWEWKSSAFMKVASTAS